MQIQVLLFAQARERAGRPRITLELPAGGRVSDALSALERLHPGLAELRPHLAVAVDQKLVGPDALMHEGAELALLPPVSGGAPVRRKPPSRAAAPARAGARFTVAPATAERWSDLERLFGEPARARAAGVSGRGCVARRSRTARAGQQAPFAEARRDRPAAGVARLPG
jgi:molybdopterin converting factor subunit 1